ncbi:hypothetical protein X566_20005 [Afipia sp. P52-10]|uniref:MT-A70 family methyltransferase n=1 Tax=Afipia sp. P52-10 TaxID=1429916 RepID=UPI0003DF3302|nr:MT-A70 family methyltransferase [Afipia sp. P52-10]ETR75899.1 hypothetical protein X566_20005 [Afipia sp. P52-10]
MTSLIYHPIADAFPLIDGDDFLSLVEDVREYGVRKPIDLFEGKILDGRNRYRALAWLVSTGEVLGDGWGHRAGQALSEDALEPDNIWFRPFNPAIDGKPVDYVASLNLRRRDLTLAQRALASAKLGRLGWGGDRSKPSREGLSTERRAEIAGVGRATVERAEIVVDRGIEELHAAVSQNSIPVKVAAEIAMQPVEKQQAIIAELPRDATGRLTPEAKKALAPLVKEMRAEKQAEKRKARDAREQQLAEKILAAPTRQYGVILEDFEWDHKPYSRATGMDRHPANHYVTAHDAHSPEEIVARTAARFACAAADSVLYMWTTIPHLFIALQVMALRGFTYKTQRIWNKVRAGHARGSGYWVTGEHEILLIGTRGKFNAAPIQAHFRSNFDAPVGEHSEKPDQQYEHAEFHFPNLPKIELNARRRRPGWDAWGLDAPEQEHPVSPSTPIAANDVTTEAPAGDGVLRTSVVTLIPEAKADVHALPSADMATPGIEPSASRLAGGRTPAGGAAELPAAPPPLAGDAHGCPAHDVPAGDAARDAAASPLFSDDPKLVELGKLRVVNHGDRAQAAKVVADLIERGYAFEIRPGDWALTRAGLARAEALQAELGSPLARFDDRGTEIPKFLPARSAADDLDVPAFLKRDANNVSPAMQGRKQP